MGRARLRRPLDALVTAGRRLQRQRPPRCPFGWRIGPPDFVGTGTHKSGTSWWYQLIRRHPDVVSRGHPKELDYFDQFGDDFTAADAGAYARWFPRPDGKLAGEWTPRYGHKLSTATRLATAAPNAKLLMLVRDPINRYRSDLTMFAHLPDESGMRRGRYGTQAANLVAAFAPEQLLILQYERCVADLATELARTYRFLGLDDSFMPRWPTRGINVTERAIVPLSEERERELIAFFEPEVVGLLALEPDLDLSLWPSMRHLA